MILVTGFQQVNIVKFEFLLISRKNPYDDNSLQHFSRKLLVVQNPKIAGNDFVFKNSSWWNIYTITMVCYYYHCTLKLKYISDKTSD